ncbi:MAG TPA: type II secretion system protein [Candidatus Saccharibacteria bacterium]|nr:type II secretion system protein [Candidatus Saccharibacteria bacterium]HRK94140.1 type II secretion system protein [Candidatus Saccharibacteria bacterium]
MNVQANKKGFTIIEVVLVLAIAALIFLMIFIALPALQRGQRDTARKQDVGTVASAVNSYRSNHRGTVPPAGNLTGSGLSEYIDKLSQVSVDDASITVVSDDAAALPNEGSIDTIKVYTDAKCADDNTVTDGSAKQAAVTTFLENGGVYCQDV